jgi:hypothetical protein
LRQSYFLDRVAVVAVVVAVVVVVEKSASGSYNLVVETLHRREQRALSEKMKFSLKYVLNSTFTTPSCFVNF